MIGGESDAPAVGDHYRPDPTWRPTRRPRRGHHPERIWWVSLAGLVRASGPV